MSSVIEIDLPTGPMSTEGPYVALSTKDASDIEAIAVSCSEIIPDNWRGFAWILSTGGKWEVIASLNFPKEYSEFFMMATILVEGYKACKDRVIQKTFAKASMLIKP